MKVSELILKRRSIRRFRQKRIPYTILEKLVNAARFAPSASNLQPLEYIIIDDKNICDKVFLALSWAGYIAPKGNPPEGKRPTAYITVLVNKDICKKGFEWDVGAAVENILLTALEENIGTCWVRSIRREDLHKILKIPSSYEIDSVVALGYKAEEPKVEDMIDSVKYWLDDQGTLHVPKRKLEDILYRNKFS